MKEIIFFGLLLNAHVTDYFIKGDTIMINLPVGIKSEQTTNYIFQNSECIDTTFKIVRAADFVMCKKKIN